MAFRFLPIDAPRLIGHPPVLRDESELNSAINAALERADEVR